MAPPVDAAKHAADLGVRTLVVHVYTALQLFEVLAASAILLYGVLSRSPIMTLLGAGYLLGKALLNILAPEGGTVYRRSIIAYAFAGLYVIGGAILVHFSG